MSRHRDEAFETAPAHYLNRTLRQHRMGARRLAAAAWILRERVTP